MELNDLKSAALAAKSREEEAAAALRNASTLRRDAYTSYNAAAAEEAGMVAHETIMTMTDPNSWRVKKTISVVYLQPSAEILDVLIVREVTSKNQVWRGRSMRKAKLSDLTPTDRKLEPLT